MPAVAFVYMPSVYEEGKGGTVLIMGAPLQGLLLPTHRPSTCTICRVLGGAALVVLAGQVSTTFNRDPPRTREYKLVHMQTRRQREQWRLKKHVFGFWNDPRKSVGLCLCVTCARCDHVARHRVSPHRGTQNELHVWFQLRSPHQKQKKNRPL